MRSGPLYPDPCPTPLLLKALTPPIPFYQLKKEKGGGGGQRPGSRQGDSARVPSWDTRQPVCHGCQLGNRAKGMEVVAPLALGRPAGHMTEGEAEGEMFGQKAGPGMPAERPEP